jgi:hypothetical protein
VKRMLIGIRTRELRLPVRMRSQHMVVDQQIVIAEPFGGLCIVLDGLWIVTKFYLGKHNTILHGESSWCIST